MFRMTSAKTNLELFRRLRVDLLLDFESLNLSFELMHLGQEGRVLEGHGSV